MKRIIWAALVLCLTLVLIPAGCSSTETPQTATPAAPAETPAKTIVLKMAHPWPATHIIHTNELIPWAKNIADDTGGKVQIDIYPAGTLLKGPDLLTGTQGDVCDIALSCTAFNPGRFNLMNIEMLPLLGFKTAVEGSTILQRTFFESFPEALDKELPNLHCQWIAVPPTWQLLMREKQVKTLDDFKGQKIVCNVESAPIFNAVGAVTTDVSQADQYVAMERGMVDGLGGTWASISAFKFYEVGMHISEIDLYGGACYNVINLNTWNSLPPDVQAVFNKYSNQFALDVVATITDKGDEIGRKAIEESFAAKGGTITSLSDAEMAKWRTLAKPIWEEWIADMEAKGLPGRDFFNEWMRIRDEVVK